MTSDDLSHHPAFDLSNLVPEQIPRIDVRSLSQEAYNHIKRLILSGVFKDGEKIPEERIANILNVSRTPIREALRQLEQYGLVEIKPRSYAKVAGVSAEEAGQIAIVRLALEGLAVKILAAKADLVNFDALKDLANQAIERLDAGNVAEANLLDSAFHLELARQSGNAVLYGILERLDAKNQLARVRANLSSERYRAYLQEHQELVRLLMAGEMEKLLAKLESHIAPKLLGS